MRLITRFVMLVHLKTLGCRLNQAELETWAQSFQKAGHQITTRLNEAHIVVVNSCAVTKSASSKSRQLIRQIHSKNPTAKLVLSGCYATLNQYEATQLLGVDLVINNTHKNQLPEKTLAAFDLEAMPAMPITPRENSLFILGRQRAFVKVQDGCRYKCTFCIVTVARGNEISRPIKTILAEINTLQQQGINEVILTGVHLGGYGRDIKTNISALIKAILDNSDIPRLRLGSLEPWELTDDFFGLFDNPRLMPHLHLPLQSGSDTVLKRMSRRCKTAEFSALVRHARRQNQNFNITTDIIVGFPGETEQEWKESYNFVKAISFGHLHIFSYSKRAGTKAAAMPNQITNAVKKQRSKQLHELAQTMKNQFIGQKIGQKFAVLWESQKQTTENNQHLVFGYTPNYIRVACKVNNNQTIENKIILAKLEAICGNYVSCVL